MRSRFNIPVLPAAHYDFVPSPEHSAPRCQASSNAIGRSAAHAMKGHQGLKKLQSDAAASAVFKDIFEKHLQELALPEAPQSRQEGDIQDTRLLRDAVHELLTTQLQAEGGDHGLRQACEDIISSLDATISRLGRLPTIPEDAEYVHDYYDQSQRHDSGFFDILKKRFLGTSDVDEAPHAVVGAKAGVSEVINRDESEEHGADIEVQAESPGAQGLSMQEHSQAPAEGHDGASRLHDFQTHSVPHAAGELATDMALSGVIGVAGYMAASAGRHERIEANEDKKAAKHLKKTLESEMRLLEAELAQAAAGSGTVFSADLLHRELLSVKWQLESVEYTLAHVGKRKQVGVGSELAGWQMMFKGVIDGICKPLAYSGAGGAHATEIAASATGFATAGLSPGAAWSGLWMGVNAKRFFHSERKEWNALLAVATEQSGLKPEFMPEDIREDFKRVFLDGKWKTHAERLQSINRLLNWFVSGMSGYAGMMTGISIHNLVQLALAGSIIAELSMSGGIITATALVLVGTMAFLRHHARFHEYEHWLDATHPVVDLDLFRELAAAGGEDIGTSAVETLRFYEGKENRRQDFLHELAWQHQLRYAGLRLHSTDPDEIKARRGEQKKASRRNASQRFTAIAARGREGAAFLAQAGKQSVHPGEWHDAFRKARAELKTKNRDGETHSHGHHHHHHHHPHHANAQENGTSSFRPLKAMKSGLRAATGPVRAVAGVSAGTIAGTFQPAVQKAKQVYARHSDRLTETGLPDLLQSPASREIVLKYLKAEAEAHAEYARSRLDTAIRGYASERDRQEAGGDLPEGLRERFRQKAVRLARDQEHALQAESLAAGVEDLRARDMAEPEILGKLCAGMVHLQRWSSPAEDAVPSRDGEQQLAKYLWTEAHEEFRQSRLRLTVGLMKLSTLIESAQNNRMAVPTEAEWPVIETDMRTGGMDASAPGGGEAATRLKVLGTPAHFGKSPLEAWLAAGLPSP